MALLLNEQKQFSNHKKNVQKVGWDGTYIEFARQKYPKNDREICIQTWFLVSMFIRPNMKIIFISESFLKVINFCLFATFNYMLLLGLYTFRPSNCQGFLELMGR